MAVPYWTGSILTWSEAAPAIGVNGIIHAECGGTLLDAHETSPTEGFSWASVPFCGWSQLCVSPYTNTPATSYTITSVPTGIETAFSFLPIAGVTSLVTLPIELLPTRLWSTHPLAIAHPILFLPVIANGAPTIPSPYSYQAPPSFYEFTCIITAHFTACCPPILVSQPFTIMVFANWSGRAADVLTGFDSNRYIATGEPTLTGPNFFHPVSGMPMTGVEWATTICSAYPSGKLISHTPHNLYP
jgi:hypothetical protein